MFKEIYILKKKKKRLQAAPDRFPSKQLFNLEEYTACLLLPYNKKKILKNNF